MRASVAGAAAEGLPSARSECPRAPALTMSGGSARNPENVRHGVEAGLPALAQRAAASAPGAKISRFSAMCDSTMRSDEPASTTSWFPTTVPRADWRNRLPLPDAVQRGHRPHERTCLKAKFRAPLQRPDREGTPYRRAHRLSCDDASRRSRRRSPEEPLPPCSRAPQGARHRGSCFPTE